MRTAIISDLHLGLASGGDVLRDPRVQEILIEEIAGADRVVLLGDAIELREQSLGRSLAAAEPFFAKLGADVGAGEVILVPGNHDHRFAEPILDRLEIEGALLGLEQFADPSPGSTKELAALLGPAKLSVAYPGVWLREDVYATHGHYIDPHLKLPRAECHAAAAIARVRGPLPPSATPGDYERILRPIYGLAFATAQGRNRPIGHQQVAAENAWEILAGEREDGFKGRAARAGFPWLVRGVNRLLGSEFDPDITPEAIFRTSLEAGVELTRRLEVDHVEVIAGHTHRGGPLPDEPEWRLARGGRLHNTGSWVFSSAFHQPGIPPNSYWPGTVTWLENDEPPRRVQLLHGYSHQKMTELVSRTAASPR
jgi:hypothetical protein